MPHAGVVAVIIGVTVATVLYFIFGNNEQPYRYHSSPSYTARSDDTEDCPICLCTLNGYKHVLKSCKHQFHRDCIEQWQQQAIGHQAVCPVCRSPFKL